MSDADPGIAGTEIQMKGAYTGVDITFVLAHTTGAPSPAPPRHSQPYRQWTSSQLGTHALYLFLKQSCIVVIPLISATHRGNARVGRRAFHTEGDDIGKPREPLGILAGLTMFR